MPSVDCVARQWRIQEPGGTYHVTSHGTYGRALFVDNDDRGHFAFRLAEVVGRFEWSCLAYCLMGTHYHLVVTTPHMNLDAGMRRLNSQYAQSFNHRHGQYGHLVRDRYYSALIEADGHFLELFRYLALNPVRAGICRHPADWHWSTYAASIGWARVPSFLDLDRVLLLFATDPQVARERLRDFVEGRARHADTSLVWGATPDEA